MSIRAVITGTGHGVPQKVLSNSDLEKIVETSDEWITQRTGIKERRICTDEETASHLSIMAAREALAAANVDPSEVDMVVCATVTGDHPFPSTSCLIQHAIGAHSAGAVDVGAACAGFIYAVDIAGAMIESGRYRRVLVVGVDTLTKFVNWEDRSTCILFGDGAGAVVMEAREGSDRGLIKSVLISNGEGARHILMERGGSKYPNSRAYSELASPFVFMNGPEVYRFAVNAMGDACCRALELAGMTNQDIDLFVPHQANLRIINSAAERLGLPDEKVFVNVNKYGNTSGGSVPLGLYEAEKEGRLKEGMVVMTVGFGAGLVWGANLIRW